MHRDRPWPCYKFPRCLSEHNILMRACVCLKALSFDPFNHHSVAISDSGDLGSVIISQQIAFIPHGKRDG